MKARKAFAALLLLAVSAGVSAGCVVAAADANNRPRQPLSRSILSSMAASDAGSSSSSSPQRVLPVRTRKVDVSDDLHGIKIADPYRWLEDSESAEVKA